MSGYALCLDYEQQIPTLQRLITVSKRTQWETEDIDWSREVSGGDYERILEWQGALRSDYVRRLPSHQKEALARQFVAFDFSQILHGEQGAMMLAGQLTNSVEDLDAKVFAAIQVKDEARHVQAVHAVIRRIGPVYPMGPILKTTLDQLIACPLWPKQVLGLQLFLEARALLSFRQHLLFVADSVFRDVMGNIERDEAQHVAFGIQYLKSGVDALLPQQREELIDYGVWLDKNIWCMTRPAEYRAVFEEAGLDFDEFEATYRPPSMLRPDMSTASKKSVEMMHDQFRRWFFSALDRIGLSEVAVRHAREVGLTVDPSKIEAPKVDEAMQAALPWVIPTEIAGGPKAKPQKKPRSAKAARARAEA